MAALEAAAAQVVPAATLAAPALEAVSCTLKEETATIVRLEQGANNSYAEDVSHDDGIRCSLLTGPEELMCCL